MTFSQVDGSISAKFNGYIASMLGPDYAQYANAIRIGIIILGILLVIGFVTLIYKRYNNPVADNKNDKDANDDADENDKTPYNRVKNFFGKIYNWIKTYSLYIVGALIVSYYVYAFTSRNSANLVVSAEIKVSDLDKTPPGGQGNKTVGQLMNNSGSGYLTSDGSQLVQNDNGDAQDAILTFIHGLHMGDNPYLKSTATTADKLANTYLVCENGKYYIVYSPLAKDVLDALIKQKADLSSVSITIANNGFRRCDDSWPSYLAKQLGVDALALIPRIWSGITDELISLRPISVKQK